MLGFRLAVSLLAIGWLVLAAGLALEARRSGPEAVLRTYLADLEAHRVEAALSALSPSADHRWRTFLDVQQFNRYQVVSLAVRSPSPLESLARGRPWRPAQATLVANILEPSGITWQGSTIVPVELIDGRWVLARPPFAPDLTP